MAKQTSYADKKKAEFKAKHRQSINKIATCDKIYKERKTMGQITKCHVPELRICKHCRDFKEGGCPAYRMLKCETSAKRMF